MEERTLSPEADLSHESLADACNLMGGFGTDTRFDAEDLTLTISGADTQNAAGLTTMVSPQGGRPCHSIKHVKVDNQLAAGLWCIEIPGQIVVWGRKT
jgi:hypothetical protein